jgi:hypothetical protein
MHLSPKKVFFFISVCLLFSFSNAQIISGKIIDALSKTPIVNAKVTIVDLEKEYLTDSTGFYKTDSLKKGNYSVRFESEKYLKQSRSVKVFDSKGVTGAIDIVLDIMLFNIKSDIDKAIGSKEIKYYFPNHADIIIEVCGPDGKPVRTVYDRSHRGGMRTFLWDGADDKGKILDAGTYSCKFKSGNLFTCRTLVWNGEQKN